MDSPAVYPRLFSTTLTFRTPQENHIVSVPFETIEKNKKCFFSLFFVSPGHLETIQNLIPGWTTIVKLLKQVKNWQSPSRDPWSNCLINSREDDKCQSYYYSGRQKDNSKTICGAPGYSASMLPSASHATQAARSDGEWPGGMSTDTLFTIACFRDRHSRCVQQSRLSWGRPTRQVF